MTAFAWSAPLQWPRGEKRTPAADRDWGMWRRMEPSAIVHDLEDALRKFGATNVVITTAMPPGRSGRPTTSDLALSQRIDPGAAVYLRRRDHDLVFALDRYQRPLDNLRAITLSIEAIRTVERYGGPGMEDRALAGFAQLPAQAGATVAHWSAVLGIAHLYQVWPMTAEQKPRLLEQAEGMYRELAKKVHPDRPGGSHEAFVELGRALEAARKELR